MAKKRKGGLAAQVAPQAKLEAKARFDPEERALVSLARDTLDTYGSDVRAAKGANRGIQAGVRDARPAVTQGYLAGSGLSMSGEDFSAPVLAGLHPDSGPVGAILAALGREREGGQRRLGEALADAQEGLTEKSLQGASGLAYAIQAAGGKRDTALSKIQAQALDLGKERGTFVSQRIGQLRKEELQRQYENAVLDESIRSNKASERNTRKSRQETRRHNVQSEQIAQQKANKPSTKRPTSGLGSLTQNEENSLSSDLDTARSWVKRIAGGKNGSYAKARDLLSTGTAASKQTNAKGEEVTVPAIPKVEHAAIVDAAIQIDRDGYIHAGTVKELNRLGLHVPSKYRPPSAATRKAVKGAAGSATNALKAILS